MPPVGPVRKSGMNSGPEPTDLDRSMPGKQRHDLLQARAGALLFVERVGGSAPLADEDDLRRRLQVGQLGMRIVHVPDDLGRSANQSRIASSSGSELPLGSGGGPPPNRPPGGCLGTSGDSEGLSRIASNGNGSRNKSVAPPFFT